MKKSFLIIFLSLFGIATMFGQGRNDKAKGPKLIVQVNEAGSLRAINTEAFRHSGTYSELMAKASVELMAVGAWLPDAFSNIQGWFTPPEAGIHLALSSGWSGIGWRPLTNCPSLTSKSGYFYPLIETDIARKDLSLMEQDWKLDEIEKEFRAQIEFILRNIPSANHISGYMGSTTFDERVTALTKRLADEYGLAFLEDEESQKKYNVEYVTYDESSNSIQGKIDGIVNMINKLETDKTYIFVAKPMAYNSETENMIHAADEWMVEKRLSEAKAIRHYKVNEVLREKKVSATSYHALTKGLPRSTPEAENIDPEGIKKFLQTMKDRSFNIHSLMVLRNGKVAYEEWFGYEGADSPHSMFSVTKTFTSTAVGFAVAEKKLKLTDKVISFFPDKLPENVSPYLKEMEVRHLLTMSAGNNVKEMDTKNEDWIREYLALEMKAKPGTQYQYSSTGSNMLSAIVQKVTGEKVSDYLATRLFRPIGIRIPYWGETMDGYTYGGYGLYVCTEDMAKLGQFILQKGEWNGKQLLPKKWFDEATTHQMDCVPSWVDWKDRDSVGADSDWKQGYGYQMWMCRHNAFRADGAEGQFIVMMPDQKAVVVITASINDMSAELNAVWDHILPAMK